MSNCQPRFYVSFALIFLQAEPFYLNRSAKRLCEYGFRLSAKPICKYHLYPLPVIGKLMYIGYIKLICPFPPVVYPSLKPQSFDGDPSHLRQFIARTNRLLGVLTRKIAYCKLCISVDIIANNTLPIYL